MNDETPIPPQPLLPEEPPTLPEAPEGETLSPSPDDTAEVAAVSQRERRAGGARERYERRRQHTSAKPAAGTRRQIRPPREIKLPQLRIPRSSGVLIGLAGAVLFVAIIVIALGSVRNSTAERHPNALWIGTEWTYEQHTEAEIAALVQRLRDHRIGTVYAWVSYLQYDGTWRAQDQIANVTAFAEQFRAAYPEALLAGWVSLPTTTADGVTTRINDVSLQQQVAEFSRRVVEDFGFQAVFLNAEPVWDGDQNFLALLRAVRSAIGPDVLLSAAIPPDWSPSNSNIPLPPLIEPGTEWATPYKQSVALLVDDLAVMAYQSGLSSADDYSQWVAYQVRVFTEAVADLNTTTGVIVGIPTFDAEPPGHDPLVENVTSAVRGIDLALEQLGDAARYVEGVAIYADWTTTDDEWAAYRQAWIDGR